MKKFSDILAEDRRRHESEIKSDEISIFVMTIQNLITKYKISQLPAADLYHDVMKKGQLIPWLEKHAEPLWAKYGYPEIGKPAWGKMEQEFIDTYLRNK